MNWIKEPLVLYGKRISVIPLEESHIDDLIRLSKHKRIWVHYAIDGSDGNKLRDSLEEGIAGRRSGTQYPFVIIHKDKIIGSSRFLDMQPMHQKLEIGWTWFHPDYWGTGANAECKLLMLTACFEQLSARRVQLRTDVNNIRSRKAIEKIGGQFEGIIRNDMVRDDGTSRDSVYYSIVMEEWDEVKANLDGLIS